MMRGHIVGRIGLAALAAGLTLLSPVTVAATGGGGPVAQSVLGSGSDTTQFMMQAIDGLYQASPGCAQVPTPSAPAQWLDFSCQSPDPAGTVTTENYQHDQVHEAYFLGSGNGLHQLCNQNTTGVAHIDFARSSKTPTSSNSCSGLHAVAYARDGISWEAFDDNTTASGIHGMNNTSSPCAANTVCLTQAQLQGIYVSCTITNWNQVGGQNVPISIYTPQAGSGTRSAFEGFLAAGGAAVDSSHCIPSAQLSTHQIPENSNTGIPTSDRAGAIFPFSYGVWSTQVNGAGNSVLGAIDGVAPSPTTIGDGTFPYSRYLYNAYCTASCTGSPAASTATVNYVGEEGWICKVAASHRTNPATGNNYRTDIANAITSNGFVPIPTGVIGGGDTNSDNCRLFTT